jgi:hypothetical protein
MTGSTLSSTLTPALFTGMLTEVVTLVGIMIPAIAGFWAFRKGWSFVRGNVKSA